MCMISEKMPKRLQNGYKRLQIGYKNVILLEASQPISVWLLVKLKVYLSYRRRKHGFPERKNGEFCGQGE